MSAENRAIPVVESYFGEGVSPLLAQTFIPGQGWERLAAPRPVTRAYVHALMTQGVTSVALEHEGRVVDFLVDELLRLDRRPLLSGS